MNGLTEREYRAAIKAAALGGDYELADAIGVEAGWGSSYACRHCGQASTDGDPIYLFINLGLDCPGAVCEKCHQEVWQRIMSWFF